MKIGKTMLITISICLLIQRYRKHEHEHESKTMAYIGGRKVDSNDINIQKKHVKIVPIVVAFFVFV